MRTTGSPGSRGGHHDRHGRGLRGPLTWPPAPGTRTRSEAFDELVLDAVELVPPSDPAPWEPQEPPMSRLFPADRDLPARIVLYRRPIETKVPDRRDLPGVVNDIVIEQLAGALGVEPTVLDPGYDPDE